MSTKFNLVRDIAGYNGFGLPFAVDGKKTYLAASAEQHFTVPSNYQWWIAIFSYTPGASIWVADGHTAEVPTGSFSDTFSELNPAARLVKAGDVLSFITNDATLPEVNVALYVAPPWGGI